MSKSIPADGQPVDRVETPSGELDGAQAPDTIPAASPGLVNDIDETGAGDFLAAHHVPIISPDIGSELIKIVRRLEVVQQVYPLPPTVEVYRLALHLLGGGDGASASLLRKDGRGA